VLQVLGLLSSAEGRRINSMRPHMKNALTVLEKDTSFPFNLQQNVQSL